jgi:SpoVK/Ycf46/Vps4 family AAA+-type ATPase
MATNRQDTLDPALLRPGRLDRKIEFPLPSRREKRLIFQTVTGKMNLGPDVDLEDCAYWLVFDSDLIITIIRRLPARPIIISRHSFNCTSSWSPRSISSPPPFAILTSIRSGT